DANAAFAEQPSFTLTLTSRVLKDRHVAAIVALSKDRVWNQLFEAGIFFHFAARPIASVRGAQELGQIAIDLACETLEMPQSMKQLGRNDQHLLSGNRHSHVNTIREKAILGRRNLGRV